MAGTGGNEAVIASTVKARPINRKYLRVGRRRIGVDIVPR